MRIHNTTRRAFVAALCLAIVTVNSTAARSQQPTNTDQNSAGLQKKLFLSVDKIGTVTDIQRGAFRSPSKVEVAVVGSFGARFFDSAGALTGAIDFSRHFPGQVKLVMPPRGGAGPFFLQQGGIAASPDSLAGPDGKELWRTPYPSVNSAFGYVGVQRKLEFFFAGQDRALEARDVTGSVVWRKENVAWAFSMDVVNDGGENPTVLIDNGSGSLIGVRSNGELGFERKLGSLRNYDGFSVTSWPPVCEQCLLVNHHHTLFLFTTDGERAVQQLDLPIHLLDAHAKAVQLFNQEGPCVAVVGLVEYKNPSRIVFLGNLYIFDPHRNLLYHEELPERVGALATAPTAGGTREVLLVGGTDRVWQYAAP